MKRATTKTFLSCLASLSLLLAAAAGFGGDKALAYSPADDPKLSPELDRLYNANPNSNATAKVVLETTVPPTRELMSQLTGNDGYTPKKLTNMTMVIAHVAVSKLDDIALRPDVRYISLDRQTKKTGHVSVTTGADAARAMGATTAYDGRGVGIAVMDSGIYSAHVAFSDPATGGTRVKASVDFTGEGATADPYGHGTHVAGIAAGGDAVSNGAYRGVASRADLVNLRVLNGQGVGSLSGLLSAMDWVLSNRAAYNLKVVNMSLGTEAVDSYRNDPLCRAARRLVDAGVVVVAAAGNQGKDALGQKVYGLVHSPGIDPSVITVGASNTFGTDARNDDTVATYSSRGPTRGFYTDSFGARHYDNLVKPDLVAPGNRLVDPQSPGNALVAQNPSLDANVSGSTAREQMFLSGTSMATPAVAGAAALLLQANPRLTPNMVKMILMYTAQPLAGFNQFEQGAGQLNLEGAMRLARLVRQDLPSPTPVGTPLLTAAAPAPQSSVAGWTFNWGGGVILDQSFATGVNLITKYQSVYGLGVLLADGTVEANGALLADAVLMSDGVTISDSIMTSNGVLLAEGALFLGCGVLLSEGLLLSDGVLLADGVILSDVAVTGDAVLMSDLTVQANRALLGDATASMQVVADTATTTTTTTPKRK
ncbi:MAG TPA: S8 family serine peptidase [Pyrinomonadaceae bacterium]|nr:S8 family serine peptidase [Pyrinomonadaceae bacterium]